MLLISFLTLFCANGNPPSANPSSGQELVKPQNSLVVQFKKALGLIPTNITPSNAQGQMVKARRDGENTMRDILYGPFSPYR